MAFADPLTLSYEGDTLTCVRLPSQGATGVFYDPIGHLKVSIAHQSGKRNRDTVRFEKRLPADAITGAMRSATVYVVIDSPLDAAESELTTISKSLADWLTVSSNANTVKVVRGEA
jgi:hypothetical protein